MNTSLVWGVLHGWLVKKPFYFLFKEPSLDNPSPSQPKDYCESCIVQSECSSLAMVGATGVGEWVPLFRQETTTNLASFWWSPVQNANWLFITSLSQGPLPAVTSSLCLAYKYAPCTRSIESILQPTEPLQNSEDQSRLLFSPLNSSASFTFGGEQSLVTTSK